MSFSKQIDAFVNKALNNANNTTRTIIGDIADELIFRTPVDTGRARANWDLGVGHLPTQYFENTFDPEGDATSNKLKSLIPLTVLGLSVYIANNTPYILTLEDGRKGPGVGSKQAPNGILKITQLRFKTIIKNATNVSR